jgi:hypothetical protein
MSTPLVGLMRTPPALREHRETRRRDDPLTQLATFLANLHAVGISKPNEGIERTAVVASVSVERHQIILPY